MVKKYELTNETMIVFGEKLFRIRALRDFGDVKNGDLGGWVEKEENLSHNGNAWVYDNAVVYGNAWIYGDAKIYGDAIVCGNARVYQNAEVYGNAWIYGSVYIYGNARVYQNAEVCGDAWIYENAWIYGNAWIYEDARVHGYAKVHGSALIFGNARVYQNAEVCGDARVCEKTILSFGVCKSNLKEDIKESIRCQTGLGVFGNKIIVYKQVKKDMTSFYDSEFKYVIGEYTEVEDCDMSNSSCSNGLHFSNMNYWNGNEDIMNSTFIMAEIDIEDVITVQQGKIRCKRAKILGKYEIK